MVRMLVAALVAVLADAVGLIVAAANVYFVYLLFQASAQVTPHAKSG